MTCGSASGDLLPFYVVYKATKVWTKWVENGPPGAKYDVSPSGWFDGITFENWFFRIFLPFAKRREGEKVVICDNLSSHVSEKVIKKCRKHRIKFVFLPPNTTHITQPLDVAFFAPTKRTWRKLLNEWKMTIDGQRNVTLPKSEFPRLLKKLWDQIMKGSGGNLRSGFAACGIVPVNVNVLLKKLPRSDDVDVTKVGNAFMKFVDDTRKQVISNVTPRRRKATNVIAGKNYWSDNSSDDSSNEDEAEVSSSEDGPEVSASKDEPGVNSISVSPSNSTSVAGPSEPNLRTTQPHQGRKATLQCDEQAAPPSTSNSSDPAVGDFVIAEFYSQRTKLTVNYVGCIQKVLPQKNFLVKFLKQYNNRRYEFVYPDVISEEEVPDDNVISILPRPSEHRGKFSFPYDVL